jgi:hypothetical protein
MKVGVNTPVHSALQVRPANGSRVRVRPIALRRIRQLYIFTKNCEAIELEYILTTTDVRSTDTRAYEPQNLHALPAGYAGFDALEDVLVGNRSMQILGAIQEVTFDRDSDPQRGWVDCAATTGVAESLEQLRDDHAYFSGRIGDWKYESTRMTIVRARQIHSTSRPSPTEQVILFEDGEPEAPTPHGNVALPALVVPMATAGGGRSFPERSTDSFPSGSGASREPGPSQSATAGPSVPTPED